MKYSRSFVLLTSFWCSLVRVATARLTTEEKMRYVVFHVRDPSYLRNKTLHVHFPVTERNHILRFLALDTKTFQLA